MGRGFFFSGSQRRIAGAMVGSSKNQEDMLLGELSRQSIEELV
jgi:hypothetical protein